MNYKLFIKKSRLNKEDTFKMEQSLTESSFLIYLVLGIRKKCHGLDSLEAGTGMEFGVQDAC